MKPFVGYGSWYDRHLFDMLDPPTCTYDPILRYYFFFQAISNNYIIMISTTTTTITMLIVWISLGSIVVRSFLFHSFTHSFIHSFLFIYSIYSFLPLYIYMYVCYKNSSRHCARVSAGDVTVCPLVLSDTKIS